MALSIAAASKPAGTRAGKTVDPDVVAAVEQSWNAGVGAGKEPAGFTVPIAELDADGDYDKAVRVLRSGADALGVGLMARRDGDDSVWFAAREKRTRK